MPLESCPIFQANPDSHTALLSCPSSDGHCAHLQEGILVTCSCRGCVLCIHLSPTQRMGPATVSSETSTTVPGLNMSRAFYAHNVHTAWWQDPNKPEQFGFLSRASVLSQIAAILIRNRKSGTTIRYQNSRRRGTLGMACPSSYLVRRKRECYSRAAIWSCGL